MSKDKGPGAKGLGVPDGSPASGDVPDQVSARGAGAVGAGGDAAYNATGKGSTVNDNRVIVHVSGPAAPVVAPLTPEEDSAAREAYAEQIRAMYGRLDLEVLIPTTEGEHPRVELREVFVPPMLRDDPPRVELPVELHRRLVERGELPGPDDEGAPAVPGMDPGFWDQARRAYQERPALPLLETLAAEDSRRLVLLGDPGAGKSTLARYVALSLMSGTLSGPLEPLAGLLPVVVELRRYAEADWRERSFEDFLAHLYAYERHAPHPALLHQCLARSQALVIFDGLDELFDPRVRHDVTQRIVGFAARYPNVRIVVTSRVIGYSRHRLDSAGFGHYMIQSLDDEQITTFARRWYEVVCPADTQESERLRTRLRDAITRSRPVRELAGNPLLLTILAIIARRQRLPRDRAGVYQHAVNVLIAHWDEDAKHLDLTPDIHAIADLDDRDRREMLELLARHMQTGEDGIAGNHVLGEDVERVFTGYLRDTLQLNLAPAKRVARAMVKQFRERNFILSRYGSEVYGFVHRAFLEYLAASDIAGRYQKRDLTDDELLNDVFARRAVDPAWHEVLLLIVGQVGEKVAGRAVDKILELESGDGTNLQKAPPAVLALRALAEVRRSGLLKEQSIRTAEALTRYAELIGDDIQATIESDIDTAFFTLGVQWPGRRHILRWLHTTMGRILLPLFDFGIYEDIVVLKTLARHACAPRMRAHSVQGLAVHSQRADMISFIADCGTRDASEDVRYITVIALGIPGFGDAVAYDFLRDRADDASIKVRIAAVMQLAEHRMTEGPDLLAFLKSRATDDASALVRRSTLSFLRRTWVEDPTVRAFVKVRKTHEDREATESDLDFLTRTPPPEKTDPAISDLHTRALRSTSPTAPDFLTTSLTNATRPEIRLTAARLLATLWSADPRTIHALRAQADAEEDEHNRLQITEAAATAEAYASIHDQLW